MESSLFSGVVALRALRSRATSAGRQRAHIVRVVHVYDHPALTPRTAPVDHKDRLGDRIVLELHAAAAGREEEHLFPEGVQLALGAVTARHIAVLQQLGGKALRALLHAPLDREPRAARA